MNFIKVKGIKVKLRFRTLPRAAKTIAPIIIKTVWMKSVQITAARPKNKMKLYPYLL